eukprot:667680-Prymnesium_polylepis.1
MCVLRLWRGMYSYELRVSSYKIRIWHFACAGSSMNGSFNIRTRQGGCGRVGYGARTDATM